MSKAKPVDNKERDNHKAWLGRMENWKFASAHRLMPKDHPWYEHVGALKTCFGDCGWMEGAMADIIGLAVNTILNESPPPKDKTK